MSDLICGILKGRKNPNDDGETLVRFFINLAQRHKFSLRKIEQCFTEMNLVLRTIPNNILLFPEILAFLVALKNYSPQYYLTLRHKLTYAEMKNVLEFIKKSLDLTDHYDLNLLARIHANLVVDYLDRNTNSKIYNQAIKDLQDDAGENANPDNKVYSTQVLQIIQNAEHEGRYRGLKLTIERLDLIRKFNAKTIS